MNSEYEDALRRAFVDERADFIFYDSRRQRFQAEGIAYGEKRGWLTGKLVEIDDQYSRYEARLTDECRKYFGIFER
jgi:hypothetical protein